MSEIISCKKKVEVLIPLPTAEYLFERSYLNVNFPDNASMNGYNMFFNKLKVNIIGLSFRVNLQNLNREYEYYFTKVNDQYITQKSDTYIFKTQNNIGGNVRLNTVISEVHIVFRKPMSEVNEEVTLTIKKPDNSFLPAKSYTPVNDPIQGITTVTVSASLDQDELPSVSGPPFFVIDGVSEYTEIELIAGNYYSKDVFETMLKLNSLINPSNWNRRDLQSYFTGIESLYLSNNSLDASPLSINVFTNLKKITSLYKVTGWFNLQCKPTFMQLISISNSALVFNTNYLFNSKISRVEISPPMTVIQRDAFTSSVFASLRLSVTEAIGDKIISIRTQNKTPNVIEAVQYLTSLGFTVIY